MSVNRIAIAYSSFGNYIKSLKIYKKLLTQQNYNGF